MGWVMGQKGLKMQCIRLLWVEVGRVVLSCEHLCVFFLFIIIFVILQVMNF